MFCSLSISRFVLKKTTTTSSSLLFRNFRFLHSLNSLPHIPLLRPSSKALSPSSSSSSFSFSNRIWYSSCGGDDYDHIRGDVNCPRCSAQMLVVFSNRPLSLTAREPGIYQAVNFCPQCKTAFYFRPFKLSPLQGSFIELGKVKGTDDGDDDDDDDQIPHKSFPRHWKIQGLRSEDDEEVEKNEDDDENGKEKISVMKLPTPKEICQGLDEFVIGQEKAKKVLV